MRAKLSATATEADWSWLTDEIHQKIENRCEYVAREYSIPADDLTQEVLLYVSVRPKAVAGYDLVGGADLGKFLHWVYLKVNELARSATLHPEESLDELTASGEVWFE